MRLLPVVHATVVTETQPLRILAGVAATHVASGGMGGCEEWWTWWLKAPTVQYAGPLKRCKRPKEGYNARNP